MKSSNSIRNRRGLIIFSVALITLASLPLLTRARAVSTSVNIVNNSSRTIRNLYVSHVNVDDWSANQLGNATIASGQSFNLSNVACDAQQIKVIGEDQDGCFLSTVITCGENSTWTINDDTPRDCGN